MNINFAMKDLIQHSGELKGNLRISIITTVLINLFINLMTGLGVLIIPTDIVYLNFTIFELFTQFNRFILIMCGILLFFVHISNNHALLLARKHDISVMKAVGSYPRQLYSFYLTELLLLTLGSYVVGYVFSLILTVGVYASLSFFMIVPSWGFNYVLSVLLGFALLIGVFVVNGWEIRKIGRRSYEDTQTGFIKSKLNARLEKPWKSFLSKANRHIVLAVKNLKRKKSLYQEQVGLIALTSMILLTGMMGAIVVDKTTDSYITDAQGDNLLVVGANSIISAYHASYSNFQKNTSIIVPEKDFLAESYNLSDKIDLLDAFFVKYPNCHYELRLFAVETVYEEVGFEIVSQDPNASLDEQYRTYGTGEFNRSVIIQGISYENTIQSWYSSGESITQNTGVIIGDTLAGQLFEEPLKQKISLIQPNTSKKFTYSIQTIFVDSLNNGNTVYLPIEEYQQYYDRKDFTNSLLIDISAYSDSAEVATLKSDLNAIINDNFGEDFGVVSLEQVFDENLEQLHRFYRISIFMSLGIALFILLIISEYLKTRVIEDKHDFHIIRAIGGKKRDILLPLFFQKLFTVVFGSILGFIFALYFLVFFFMENAQFPSILVPLGSLCLVIGVLIGIARLNIAQITKRYFISEYATISN